jgi:hypothetical protein
MGPGGLAILGGFNVELVECCGARARSVRRAAPVTTAVWLWAPQPQFPFPSSPHHGTPSPRSTPSPHLLPQQPSRRHIHPVAAVRNISSIPLPCIYLHCLPEDPPVPPPGPTARPNRRRESTATMASVTSLDQDMKKLRMGRYTPHAANEARVWIEDTLGERLPPGDLLDALKDGTALCKYVDSMYFERGLSYLLLVGLSISPSRTPASNSKSRPCPSYRWRISPTSSAPANSRRSTCPRTTDF